MNPCIVYKFTKRSEKIIVRCGQHESIIESPYFFSEPSVTGLNFKRILRYCALSKIHKLPRNPILDRNGAPVPYSVLGRHYLYLNFGDT